MSKFEAVWRKLETLYAVEPSSVARTSTRTEVLRSAVANDPVAAHLSAKGMVLSTERDGRLHITCPFADEHTSTSAESSTSYFPANTGGYAQGHFKCLHAHCDARTQDEFKARVGLSIDPFEDFDVLENPSKQPEEGVPKDNKFKVHNMGDFAKGGSPSWIIKGFLPKAELAVIFGEPGTGKSFFAFDILCSIARGEAWRGLKTKQGSCLYVASEGASGFRNRALAYAEHHGVALSDIPIGVIGNAPNLMNAEDVKDLLREVAKHGNPSVIVIDTLAASMPGGNENAGEDMGRVVRNCKAVHKATGALVVLIHHSGKDSSKGARGWSGLRGAIDCEIEVVRNDNLRAAVVTKQKDGDDTINNTYGFTLPTVVLGKDEDGDPITSCVCVAADMPIRVGKGKGIDNTQLLIVEELGTAELISGGVYVKELETRVAAQLPVPEGADNRLKKVQSAVNALVAAGLVVLADGMASLPIKKPP